MNTEKCNIIIPTHSSYMDVCENFLAVLKKNWPDCCYRIIISVTGENVEISSNTYIYNGANATLPECILNAARSYPAASYMIFLGDAFLMKRISMEMIDNFVETFIQCHYEYCCLRPKTPLHATKMASDVCRYIHVKDRYSHSFIAFLASPHFLKIEFQNEQPISDRDFEIKYLNFASDSAKNFYFRRHVILTENIMGITPGIEKGKWNRLVLYRLKKTFPEIKFCERGKISIEWQLILLGRRLITPFVSNNVRIGLKKIMSKEKNNFDTMT